MTKFEDDINFQILETLAKIIIKSCLRRKDAVTLTKSA